MRYFQRDRLWLLVVLTGASSAGALHAQTDRVGDGRSTVSGKLFALEMRGKPWMAIFEWLTDQTGLPFVSKYPPPPGTFNFIAKADKRYTLGELVDLLNDGLAAHKYVLLRGPTCWRLLPADERVDKTLIAHVPLDELPGRGHSELVEIVAPLRILNADEYALEVRKMMGPFGEVIVLRQGNRLLMHDTAGNLRRILALTRDMDESNTRTINLDRHNAADAAELLRRMLEEMGRYPVKVNSLR